VGGGREAQRKKVVSLMELLVQSPNWLGATRYIGAKACCEGVCGSDFFVKELVEEA
jgi:hypothetical protein